MSAPPDQQAEPRGRAVTSASRRPGTPAAERKRQQRRREREQQQLLYETADWQLFTELATLPQKAGCQPEDLRKIVLKELVDNALDAGAGVSLDHADGAWVVADDGPGLDPAEVPRLFAVNRPLLSSKLVRLPLRGMLGNGLRVVAGAVAAAEGSLVVETRGRRLTLAVCRQTGRTTVVSDEPVPPRPGVVVRLSLGPGDPSDGTLARASIAAARWKGYAGPSSPWWYGGKDLHRLFARVAPADTTVGALCRGLGLELADDRPARDPRPGRGRSRAGAPARRRRAGAAGTPGLRRAGVRPDWPGYARKTGTTTTQAGARIPYVVEAWAVCSRPAQKGQGGADQPARQPLDDGRDAPRHFLAGRHRRAGLRPAPRGRGAGHRRLRGGPGRDRPHVQLATDGKEPSLAPFSEAIAEALRKACGAAHRAMRRPERGISVKDAAWAVMEDAYRLASGGGRYPANARQIMCAARPDILRLTGKDRLDDHYFTQKLLPDYVAEHPARRPSGTSCSTPAAASSSRTPAARCGSAPSTSAPTSANGPPSATRSL